ncbi:MAG: HAD hydrolase-like protein [Acidobacteria bacterium]|nr:HAD hydrolase-like protein [Acidobacteriota bacterium]
MFDVIAFDADDTLWHNEPLYRGAQHQVLDIMAHYHDRDWIERQMYETEIRNLVHYGYGIKGFTLSMIETAIELTEGRITGAEIGRIIELTREMFKAPVELLDGVEETIKRLGASHDLMLITKGDLFEQQAKIARSGLADHFSKIEIVPVKISETYQSIAVKHEINPQRFLMIGNSIRSDILPVLEMGGRAVHIPYQTTWEHEVVPEEELAGREFIRLTHIRELPALIDELKNAVRYRER